MTPLQRRATFEKFFSALARKRTASLGLSYVGTIRQVPPPPLPGEPLAQTHYYVNATKGDGGGPRLVDMGASANLALRKAEKWVETGLGVAPIPPATKKRARR